MPQLYQQGVDVDVALARHEFLLAMARRVPAAFADLATRCRDAEVNAATVAVEWAHKWCVDAEWVRDWTRQVADVLLRKPHRNWSPSDIVQQLVDPPEFIAFERGHKYQKDNGHAVIRRINYTLTPDLVDEIIARLREEVDPEDERAARRRVEQQIAAVDQQTENLAEAIAIGGDVPALVARMKNAHQRRQELTEQLKAAEVRSPAHRVNWTLVERRARQRLADWRGLLSRQVDQARPVLRGLLDGPIRFTPIIEEARRGYAFAGGLYTGAVLFGIVEGNQSDLVWRPRTDLNRRPRA